MRIGLAADSSTHRARILRKIHEIEDLQTCQPRRHKLASSSYYEAQNDDTKGSETILLCNRCACNWKFLIPSELLCEFKRIHRKYLMEAPESHEKIPAGRPCVTDVLCNWEIHSQRMKCVCKQLGPIVTARMHGWAHHALFESRCEKELQAVVNERN